MMLKFSFLITPSNELPKDHFQIREIDTLKVKGKSEPVQIYEIFDAELLTKKRSKLETKQIMFSGIVLSKQFSSFVFGMPENKIVFRETIFQFNSFDFYYQNHRAGARKNRFQRVGFLKII